MARRGSPRPRRPKRRKAAAARSNRRRRATMNPENVHRSDEFIRLYGDAGVFNPFSAFHPVSFQRVLPFQSGDPAADDRELLAAEEAHLAERSERRRLDVVDAYARCGLLPRADAINLRTAVDFYR